MPINPKIISRSVRNAASGLEVRLNRLLKREFIPPHEGTLSIDSCTLSNNTATSMGGGRANDDCTTPDALDRNYLRSRFCASA